MDSRLTFREKCPSVCWQKQLRDKYLDEGVPDVNLDLKKSFVRSVSRKTAEQIIYKYEWLGTMGAGVERSYGIFFGNYCAGVTTFANSGAIPALVKTFHLTSPEVTYLTRGACTHWAPKGTNSKLISISCLMEGKAGKKIVIAFADSDAGEVGTVYQASNWIYIGKGNSWFQWVSPFGKILSSNSVTKRRSNYDCRMKDLERGLIATGWAKQWSNPKGRYVYILDKKDHALRKIVESMRQPYPKRKLRGGSDTVDTAGVHPAEGGSTPTPPLH